MAIQENSVVSGRNGQRYTLGAEIGAGGEGRVFKISGQNLVGKIYKKVDPEVEKKIRYMVQHPIADLRDSSGKTILALAWPQDILCDDRGVFIGYTMPFIQNGVEICTVARGCDMPKAKTMFPNYDWMFNLQVAINLSKAVAYLHSKNCIVGDLNCKNIMVSPGGLITMLDNDSFDMVDAVSGIHFRCCAGTQDYLAPELQGRNLRSAGAVFSVHSDNFALAIHIFQLLMNNYHPFTGKNLVVIQNSTSVNQRLDHLVNGKCPFIHTYSDLTVPIGAPYLNEMVTPQLVQDFYRTFNYNAGNIPQRMKLRTTAAQWVTDLQQFMDQLYTPGQAYRCRKNQKHYYLRQAGKCGLCAAEERLTNFRNQQAASAPPKPTPPEPTPTPPKPTPPTPPKPTSAPTLQSAQKSKSPSELVDFLAFVVAVVCVVVFLPNMFSKKDKSPAPEPTSYISITGSQENHTHNWISATYTRPEYCSSCGQERGNVRGYLGTLYGEYKDMTIGNANCGMLTLSTPIVGMRSMTLNFEVEMNYGARCENWTCYTWNGEQWIELGVLTVPGGTGSGSCTFYG
ncbi:MAG: protein kinase, partial [Oscillospiraceae bacterium]|nr:protein kinase [Oscillospiraceae bacterium]